MEYEMRMAYRVQSSLIPKKIPQYPGWEFVACLRPAGQVSGDFYDFIEYQGDFMVCITDGVLDAINTQGEAYMIERFQKVVRENLNISASGLVEAIERSVQYYSGDRSLCDDLTILIINREG